MSANQITVEVGVCEDLDCPCGVNPQWTTRYTGGGHNRRYGCVDVVSCPECGQEVVLRERYYD